MSIDRFKGLPLLLGLLMAACALALPTRAAAQSCSVDNAEIRLADRFVITASAGDLSVRALCLTKTTTGAFLFGSDGLQAVAVRMLDGRNVNGKYWFFSGALTDLPYEIRVEDTINHVEKTYANTGGFASFVDSDTFSVAPPEPDLPAAVENADRPVPSRLAGSATASADYCPICAPARAPDFSFTPALPRVGEVVTFDGRAAEPLTKWEWDFGHGFMDFCPCDASMSHAFPAAGHYDVKLTVIRSSTGSVEKCCVSRPVVVCGFEAKLDGNSSLFTAASGTGIVNVTVTPADPSCTWSASSDQDFLRITEISGRQVTFRVLRNERHAIRKAKLTVAGRKLPITQQGADCQYTLSPVEVSFPAAGGEETKSPVPVTVTPADCALSARTALDSPIKVSTDSDGKLFYTVADNPDLNKARSATIEVLGEGEKLVASFTVRQEGCAFNLTPDLVRNPSLRSLSFLAKPIPSHVGSAPQRCQLAPVSTAPFFGVTRPAKHPRQVQVTADPNPSSLERTGTVTIAGVPFPVHQQGCAKISQQRMTFPLAPGESNQVHVMAPEDCRWTVENNAGFVRLTQIASEESAIKKGDATFEVAVAPSGHLGALSIAGRLLLVEQRPAPASGCASPSALSGLGELFEAAGGVGTLLVTPAAGCSWELKTEASSFLKLGTPDPATNAVPYCVAANRNAFRGGIVAITDKVLPDTPAGESPFLVRQLARNGGDPVAPCAEDPKALCLLGGRYEVRVTHGDTRETRAEATVSMRRFPKAGSFWFFNEEIIELVVKVEENPDGSVGVFFGALTSLPYVVTVTDTQTGEQAFYCNLDSLYVSQGHPAALPLPRPPQ